ncbi:Cytochrome c oxidase biogenesis Cmc1-like [Micractinium conductrix]|uniref:Cytochrome c oxidase biogenesis Cmc1-like n=1 Tax=Micractinium conductrix TaxID=554055 RepID=A0A2P6VG90_9CHLO|nr:Cytochrome c oxidase biogenesis Cmc1-like [Micractinium conductrix]|eukprot:PSC73109.1 Cytochrome c oxidase biogenesis Cmc1-like [Micractinium conductrix]
MSGRTLSAAWACRPEMFALSDCLSKHTGRLDELKARYVAAGQPTHPDWDSLLEGL